MGTTRSPCNRTSPAGICTDGSDSAPVFALSDMPSRIRAWRRFGNLVDHPRHCPALAAMLAGVLGDVGLADDPDDAVAVVEDRNPADPVPGHCLHALLQWVAHVTRENFVGHAVINASPQGVGPIRYEPDRDVAVGDHAEHAALPVNDRDGAA